jgi:hypothetical protein
MQILISHVREQLGNEQKLLADVHEQLGKEQKLLCKIQKLLALLCGQAELLAYRVEFELGFRGGFVKYPCKFFFILGKEI